MTSLSPSTLACLIWLIPGLPLGAAAIGALTPRGKPGLAAAAAIGALGGSLVLSVLAFARVPAPSSGLPLHWVSNFTWFEAGADSVRLGCILDPLTAFMLVMVTFIGLLIFIFSTGYMAEDPNKGRFFCFLSLFAAAMLGLLVSNSLLGLFICWELVGLASYLLIGFWFHKPEAAAAAKKAFITTRIGDLGLLIGMVWLSHSGGTLLFYDHGQGCLEPRVLSSLSTQLTLGGLSLSTAIGLLIFCGAVGKSGQFPLHVWLPDAMEGPTPVSALIHAATMVAAGVFLVARVYPLLSADQGLSGSPIHALSVVAGIGAITALLGAVIAVAQTDIKRVLAFSTVSQLGYMMLAAGVGSWVAAIFHLLTHAFFKALLFLGAGSVIHGSHHEQDIRRLGGLRGRMRLTFATFAVGMMALAGFPFLFSGFWSKEAILHAAAGWEVSRLPLVAALSGVALTAFYMTRLLAEVFGGTARSEEAGHAHESPASMTAPLVLLGVCAVVLGFLGTPLHPWLQSKLTGSTIAGRPLFEEGGLLMAASVGLVAAGVLAGWVLYVWHPRTRADAQDPLREGAPGVFDALTERLGFDRFYAATVGRLSSATAWAADAADTWIWGGAVRALARFSQFTGWVGRETDEDGLNAGFDATSAGIQGTGRAYSRNLTGDPTGYMGGIALGFVVLAAAALLGILS